MRLQLRRTCASLALALPTPAPAADPPDETREELPTAILDPLTPQLRASYTWIGDFRHLPGDAHTIALRPVIPFPLFGVPNVARITVPYHLDGPDHAQGLGVVRIVDLVVVGTGWGGVGFGPAFAFEPLSPEPGRFSAGPAVGVVHQTGPWTLGVFNQNAFGHETAISAVQPLVEYHLTDRVSVSTGELQITFDWRETEIVLLPLGAQLNVLVLVAEQPIRFEVNPQYNLVDVVGTPSWLASFSVAFLIP